MSVCMYVCMVGMYVCVGYVGYEGFFVSRANVCYVLFYMYAWYVCMYVCYV